MDGSNLSPKGQITRTIRAAVTAQKKLIVALIFALLAVLLLIIVVANITQKSNIILQTITPTKSKEPTVSLKKEYKNPFDKNAQYVNPFSQYKNPFDNLIK